VRGDRFGSRFDRGKPPEPPPEPPDPDASARYYAAQARAEQEAREQEEHRAWEREYYAGRTNFRPGGSRPTADSPELRALGLTTDATPLQIRARYLELMKQHHPDKNPGDAEAERRCKEITAAYQVLTGKGGRRRYE